MRHLAVTAVLVLIVSPLLWRLLEPTWLVVTGLVALVFAAGVGLSVRANNGSEEETDDSVWQLIPSWQYGGRHVESGGLTRDEQEQSLKDLESRAMELENHETRRDR